MRTKAPMLPTLVASTFFAGLALPALAKTPDFGERQRERDESRWSFSNYLAGKAKLEHQDILYRFYTGGDSRNKPRLEPYVYGLGLSGSDGRTGAGYGGSVYFNNFLSHFLEAPTPNMVLGAFAERVEEKKDDQGPLRIGWGGSIRLFGLNEQDTSLSLNYRVIRGDFAGISLREQRWEVAARVYAVPHLSFEGSLLLKDDLLPSRASPLVAHRAYTWGGSLDVLMFRLTLLQQRDRFSSRDARVDSPEETRYVLRVGFVI